MAGARVSGGGTGFAVTSVANRAASTAAAEPARQQSRRMTIGLLVADVHFGVILDAVAPVAVQISALVDLANSRLREIGQPPLAPTGALSADGKRAVRGRWALCWVDGTPLRPGRSLTEQGVVNAMDLWLRFIDDTEARTPVIEHVTSAVPAELRKHWKDVDPLWAARVGVSMVAAAVLLVCAVAARWRYGHDSWVPAAVCGGVAVVALVAAVIVAAGAGAEPPVDDTHARMLRAVRLSVGDVLMLAGAAAAAVAAGSAVTGPVGAPQAGLGAAVLVAASWLIMRFTGRHVGLCTALLVLGLAAVGTGLARMLLTTSAVTLLTCVLLVTIVGIKVAPTVARWAAGIRLPVFPSASGRWIFETRPDLPSTVVVAGGQDPVLEGPESVRDVVVATDRAHSYLSGLLAGFGVLLVISCAGVCDPGAGRRWLALVLAGVVAAAVLLHGRSYTDRWQATVLAVTAVAIVVAVSLRYAVQLWSAPAVLVACAVILVVPAAGLIAAVVVPNHYYTPVFRYTVEWIEYALLFAVYPLGFWLMNVFAAIRYRS